MKNTHPPRCAKCAPFPARELAVGTFTLLALAGLVSGPLLAYHHGLPAWVVVVGSLASACLAVAVGFFATVALASESEVRDE